MHNLLDKLSIGKKTVGFVTLLLAMMLGISVYSFYRIRIVSNEVNDIATWIVPIDDLFCAIETHTLAEEVHLQRALRFYGEQPVNQKAITQELLFLKSRHQMIADDISQARAVADQALAKIKVPTDGIIVGQTKALLDSFDNQHQQFVSLSFKVLDAVKRGDLKAAKVLEGQLDEEEDRLDRMGEDIRANIATLTEARSRQIAQDEQGVFWLSLENLTIAGIAFLLGVWVSTVIARRLVSSLRQILSGAENVSLGNLNVQVPVASTDEIGMLAQSFNQMIEELKHKELIKSKFSEYIDPRVVETLLAQDSNTSKGERQVMTVFFSDIAGFSTIAEMLTPLALVQLLNEYLTLASEPILRHKGVIDKYIGDAIMSFWGPPFTDAAEHARFACLAGLEQFEQLKKLELRLPELLGVRQGLPTVNIRVGICTGELVVGNIGSATSKSYTVMGDTVNIAARLESANKQYGTRILISHETYRMVKDDIATREIDNIVVMGKTQPVRIYELLGTLDHLSPDTLDLKQTFERGLGLYRQQDWAAAEASFVAVLERHPHDGPAQVFLERVRTLKDTSPPPDWDGVWRMSKK